MPAKTDFLPAERLERTEILAQAEQIDGCSVLLAMIDNTTDMVALLNPQRQIVLCNDACVKAGGLANKQEAIGMRPGELLHCIHATDMPGGCGTAESCRHCGLAKSLVAGQQGRADLGQCLMEGRGEDRNTSAEYAVQVKPLAQLGDGWQCYSLSDISAEKRRDALERIFFHDIMNRASAVEGVSSVLVDEETTPTERDEFISMLSTSAHALVEEIRSQQILMSAEKGELAVTIGDCDSLDALRSAASLCQTFGYGDKKQVVVRSNAQAIRFRTDATLLGRVLVNLLKNAIEASDPGGSVTASCTRSAPGSICFGVHNNGVMPAKVKAHVFQRSFSTKGSGRGLGTYSIRLLTETYLGGRVWFDSSQGKGTAFFAEFPVNLESKG